VVLPIVSLKVWAIAMNGPIIYIGTDVGVFRSMDGSGNWDLLPNPSFTSGLNNPVRALGIDPSGTVTLYAGTNGKGVFKRAGPNNAQGPGSQPWNAVNFGLTAVRAKTVALGSLNNGSKAVFVGLEGGGVITSTDGGTTWPDTAEATRTVRALAVDPTN